MADNNDLKVVVGLNLPKSVLEIKKDLVKLADELAGSDDGKLKIVGQLDLGATEKKIKAQLSSLKIDSSALKITPTIDTSSASQLGNQITKQLDTATQKVDFSAIAKNLRKAFNINDNASIKEATENIKAMYEAFNVDPEKYKDAFNKLIGWYEQRSKDFVYTERQKVDELNNLMLELYNQPELHIKLPGLGKASKDNPLLVTKGTLEEMKSILGSMQEVYKLFGSVKIDDKHGALIGSFGEDWDPKEYNDALAVYIQYLQKIQELRKASRFQPTDVMPQSEYNSIIKLTEQSILEQLNLVNANNKVIQSNEKVAQSERDVTEAQKELNNAKKSVNTDKGNDEELKKLTRSTDLLMKMTKQYELIKYYQEQQRQSKAGTDEWEYYNKAWQEEKQRLDVTKQVAQAEGLVTEEYKKQTAEAMKRIDEKYAQLKNAKNIVSNNGGNYLSNNQVQDIFASLNEAEKYFKNFNLGTVTSSLAKGQLQGLKDFVIELKSATGEVEKFRYAVENIGDDQNPQLVYKLTDIKAANAGIQRLAEAQAKLEVKTEGVRAKYTRLLEEFKSSNSAIQSGLTQPIQEFETVLKGLGTTHSIEDVKNQFESLKTSAAEISKYLDTTNNSFNKTRNAINNYNQMDDAIKRIEASYGNLVIKNEQLGTSVTNLRSSYDALVKKEKEQGGYTAEWAKDYQAVNAALKEVRVNVEAAVRAESNSQNADRNSLYQVQQRYLDRIRQNYIELNKLQNALVNAGKNETAEIQKQIKQVRSRISYATEQLKKRQLFANVEAQINDYENEFDRKQSLRNSKETDKLIANYTKMADEISRATQELTKLQNSSTIKDNGSNAVVQNLKVQIDSVITDFNNLYERLSNSTVDKKTFVELQDQLSNIANKAKEVKNSFNDVSNAISADNKAKSQLASFQKQVESLTASIKALQSQANVSAEHKASLGELLNEVGLAKDKATLDDISTRLTRLKGEIRETINNTSASNNLNKEFDNLSKSIDTTISKLTSLRDSSIFRNHSANSDVAAMKQQLDALIGKYEALKATITSTDRTSGNLNTLKGQVKTLGTEFETASGKAKQFQTTLRQNDATANLETRISRLTNQIKEYMAVNTKASKKYGTQFSEILNRAEVAKDIEEIKRLNVEFVNLRSQIKIAGDQGKTLFQEIAAQAKKFSAWLSISSLIMRGIHSLRQMVNTVKEIDKAMTSLKKVTNETADAYNEFLDNTRVKAQQLHSSIVDIVEQTETWVKLGHDLDTASKLAEVSMMYAKVGDVDNESAVKDLVAAMKAFNIEADNAIDIVSMLDKLNNEFAVSAKDLGEGLTVTASAMAAGGNSLEKTLSLMTGAGEITQDLQGVSNALRTISMRIRGLNQPLKQLYRLKSRSGQDRAKIYSSF